MNKVAATLSLVLSLVVILVVAGCGQQPAPAPAPKPAPAPTAQTAAKFYEGNVITILVPAKPGDSVDLYTRAAAQFLSEKTGSRVGLKYEAGAGGIVGFNEFSKTVKPDGLTLLCSATGMLWVNWLLGVEGATYEIANLEYLGGAAEEGSVIYVSPKGPYTTVKALQQADKQLRFIQMGAASDNTLGALLTADVLKLNAKVITGFAGTAARALSLQKGDGDVTCAPIALSVQLDQQGQVKVLCSLRDAKSKFYPNLSILTDFAELTPTQKTLMKGIPPNTYAFAAPAGTPKDRVEFLRGCFDQVFASKDYLTIHEKIITPWTGSRTGAELQKMASDLATTKAEQIKLWDALKAKYSQ